MNDLRTAAQQALNYWESASFGDAVMVDKMHALRAALAQQTLNAPEECEHKADGWYAVQRVAGVTRVWPMTEAQALHTAPPKAEPVQEPDDGVCDGLRGGLCIHQDPNQCDRQRDCPASQQAEPVEPVATLGYARKIEGLIAQRDALLDVVQKFVAWSEAERDHSGTTFWQRVDMCREVDALAHAAIKAVEGGA